jgi:zinc transport system substrate-binding protein
MKKILLALLMLAFVVGCSDTRTAEATKPQIYTSFYAIYDFTREIGGDRVEIHNLVPSGTEPHDWEPSTQAMLGLSRADALIYNGSGMENWVDKVKDSVNDERLRYVELSEGIAVEGSSDPHIWLDPINVISMCDKICTALSEIDPDNAEYYKANLEDYTQRLKSLDEEYATALDKSVLKSNKLVVSHEAYSYLCAAYSLEQVAIDGINADSEPTPARLKEIVELVKSNGIKYIFYEELLSPKTAQTISGETGAELLELNPFEGVSDENSEGADYISVMENNLKNLEKALK